MYICIILYPFFFFSQPSFFTTFTLTYNFPFITLAAKRTGSHTGEKGGA